MNTEIYKNYFSIYEFILYIGIVALLYISTEINAFLKVLPFLLIFARITVWDYRYKMIPLHLLVFCFISSFVATDKELFTALNNGLVMIGGCVVLNHFAELYSNYRYKNNDEEIKLIGEGDLPLIGAIGVMFDYEMIFSSLMIAAILIILIYLIRKDKEIAFAPALLLSFVFHYVYNQALFF